jgi:hypothetical protein
MAPHDPADALTMGLAILLIVVVAVVWTLTGCAVNPCVKPVVSLPEPALPVVRADEMQCLSDSAYTRLAERDVMLQSALRECRAVVEETTDGP